jgi:hypothetical protein
MSSSRQTLLPLNELDPMRFEEFVLHFLGAKISLAVIEPTKSELREESKSARYSIVSATLYGSPGPAGQRGIDIKAMTETGAEWVFQCKHYRNGFPRSKAEDAVKKAQEEYPKAARYFLILSGEPIPDVRDFVESNPRWEIWGRSELSIRFFNEVEPVKQLELLRLFFPQNSDALIAQLFPLHDDPLITTEQFFEQWNEPNRIFNHRAPLVGRENDLAILNDFVRDPALQVLILPAPGGVGKTRLLRAFGESFATTHGPKKLFFVDPSARLTSASDRLRTAAVGELVVVQDDAHRSESLRSDLFSAVVEKNGKLLLATRPHAVDSLIAWLSLAGVDASTIRTIPSLANLTPEQLVELAHKCLPPAHQQAAESLATLAKGCSLIVTVAAALISQDKLVPAAYPTSVEFQHAVFTRFETAGFSHVANNQYEPLVKEALRLLAVLAPWNERILALDAVANLLGCTVRVFQETFGLLRAAGLLVETREGWRVVPDLFADYLVYRGCYDESGHLTNFARGLQQSLIPSANGIILRNLAETEWQARLKGQQIESLLDPFWKDLRTKFIQKDFYSRAELIKQWSPFAVLQPEHSIELAQLGISLTTAPPMAVPAGFARSLALDNHEQVLAVLPALLEQIATYDPAYRTQALNLLWDLHRKFGRVNENAANDPLAAIGKVAKYHARHPVNASLEVVEWVAQQLNGPNAADFCDHHLPVLSVILKPIFERDVEDNFSTGRTITFRTYPLSVENTRRVRERALQVLSNLVIPRGEVATLNALNVLTAAIDVVQSRWRNVPSLQMQEEWLPERRAALAIIENSIHPQQSVRVLYRIRKILRPHAIRDLDPSFQADCARVLATIPDTPALQLTTVLMSEQWAEFFFDVPHAEAAPSEARSRVEKMWVQLCESVAGKLIQQYPTATGLVDRLSELIREHEDAGLTPQCDPLFRTIAQFDLPLATGCINLILASPSSPLDRWWASLFAGRRKLPDPELREWIRLVLLQDNTARWRPILFGLHWAGIGEVSDAERSELKAWAGRIRDDTLSYALELLRMRFSDNHALGDIILAHFDLSTFSDSSLMALAEVLERTDAARKIPLPAGFADRFIQELDRVQRIDWHGGEVFFHALAEAAPVRFYEMLKGRVLTAESRRKADPSYSPLPFATAFTLDKLSEAEDYPKIARDLFARVREFDVHSHLYWRQLFQIAVLRVSPLGMTLMEELLPEIKTGEELLTFIQIMQFEGSIIIFLRPDLVRTILQKALEVAPTRFEEIRWYLGNTASPHMRGYTDHVLDPEQRYYREEAAKAAAIHSNDPYLSAFYREIVRLEDADAARHKREAELDLVEW